MTEANGGERLGLWARLRRWIRGRGLPQGFDLAPEPRTTRLNRRVFLVVAVMIFAVIWAAVATLVDADRARREARVESARVANPAPDPFWKSEPDGVALPEAAAGPPEAPEVAAESASSPVDLREEPPLALGTLNETREETARLRRAYEAPPLVAGFRRTTPRPDEKPGELEATRATAPPADTTFNGLAFAREPDSTIAQNNQASKRTFLETSAVRADGEVNPHLVTGPLSPFEVTTGTVIPAVLLTEANSDLPGLLTARVRENVYDSVTGEHLLIPQGTVITGAYDSVVTYGQERLLVAWQRLLFPDGTKLNLGSMPGVDALGAAGFEDQVEHHYLRIFGSATLLSVISAGLQISQGGVNSRNTSENQNLTDTLGAALGQNLGEAASQLIRRNLNVQPKIEIRSGYRFNVFVRKDLVFQRPYDQA